MHELSIAQSILEIVQLHTPTGKSDSVKSIRVKVGEMSGVVPESLDFCFNAIILQTPFRDATLQIDRVPYSLHCNSCSKPFTSDTGAVVCPSCGGTDTTVLAGDELQVTEIELRDDLVEAVWAS